MIGLVFVLGLYLNNCKIKHNQSIVHITLTMLPFSPEVAHN